MKRSPSGEHPAYRSVLALLLRCEVNVSMPTRMACVIISTPPRPRPRPRFCSLEPAGRTRAFVIAIGLYERPPRFAARRRTQQPLGAERVRRPLLHGRGSRYRRKRCPPLRRCAGLIAVDHLHRVGRRQGAPDREAACGTAPGRGGGSRRSADRATANANARTTGSSTTGNNTVAKHPSTYSG